jgi:hypothetical protein
MIQLYGKSAQALFGQNPKKYNFFYSLSHNDLSASRPRPGAPGFDKSAQVRAIG